MAPHQWTVSTALDQTWSKLSKQTLPDIAMNLYDRSFVVFACKLCNNLPPESRYSLMVNCFKSRFSL